jgi:hypothetical protein
LAGQKTQSHCLGVTSAVFKIREIRWHDNFVQGFDCGSRAEAKAANVNLPAGQNYHLLLGYHLFAGDPAERTKRRRLVVTL